MKPTQSAISANLARLRIQRPFLPPSAFGDDNAGACAAQIEVIQNNLTEAQIYDKWPADEDVDNPSNAGLEHLLFAALDCRRWLDGTNAESPADSWEPMYRRATGKKV